MLCVDPYSDLYMYVWPAQIFNFLGFSALQFERACLYIDHAVEEYFYTALRYLS